MWRAQFRYLKQLAGRTGDVIFGVLGWGFVFISGMGKSFGGSLDCLNFEVFVCNVPAAL